MNSSDETRAVETRRLSCRFGAREALKGIDGASTLRRYRVYEMAI